MRLYPKIISPLPGIIDFAWVQGMIVETAEAFEVGRSYSFKIRVRGKVLSWPGVPVWCSLKRKHIQSDGRGVSIYRAGIDFHDEIPETILELFA